MTTEVVDLEQLHRDWERDYPGDSTTIRTLRDHLTTADWDHRRARLNLLQFQQHLDRDTGLPLYLWDNACLKRFTLLQRLVHQAHRDFHRALKAIQSSFEPAIKTQPASEPAPAPEPEPEPPVNGTLFQSTSVAVVDGQVITKTNLPAQFWVDRKDWDRVGEICRQFYFVDAVIPEPYAYVLRHRDGTYEAVEDIDLYYKPEEFLRLCRLEIETNSPHLLDGERCGYGRHKMEPPISLPARPPRKPPPDAGSP